MSPKYAPSGGIEACQKNDPDLCLEVKMLFGEHLCKISSTYVYNGSMSPNYAPWRCLDVC